MMNGLIISVCAGALLLSIAFLVLVVAWYIIKEMREENKVNKFMQAGGLSGKRDKISNW